jgi:hypothetical protein
MLDTVAVDSFSHPQGVGCPANAGAYYLPKRVFSLKVAQDGDNNFALLFDPTTDIVPVADRTSALCLDFLSAPTSDDTITIKRSPEGLLEKIFANAEDKSAEIASSLIDLGRLVAVDSGARAARANKVVRIGTTYYVGAYEIDPFNRVEAATVNQALREFGYCVYVEGFTFDPTVLTPEAYCNQPRRALQTSRPEVEVLSEGVVAESRRGVLYRPNELHQAIIMSKPDPKGRYAWRMFASYSVEMPNVAPVFSVGVDRSFFTTRKTMVTFDAGVLKGVELEKGSELNAVADVTLRLAQAITSIPAQIVQVRLNRVGNQRALIAAQAQLLETYRAYRKEVGLDRDKPVSEPGPVTKEAERDAIAAQCLAAEKGDVTKAEACVKRATAGDRS